MMRIIVRLGYSCLVIALLGASGCATVERAMTSKSPGETLGINRSMVGKGVLPDAFTFIAPPPFEKAMGFEIAVPAGAAPMGPMEWTDLDGKVTQIRRKAARVRIDGRLASAYPLGGKWFVLSEKRPGWVEIFSVSGVLQNTPIVREVDRQELTEIYADLAAELPCLSQPINGTRLMYYDTQCRKSGAVPGMRVPDLHDPIDRCAFYGLCRLSTNPTSYVAGAVGFLLSKPRTLNSSDSETQPGAQPPKEK